MLPADSQWVVYVSLRRYLRLTRWFMAAEEKNTPGAEAFTQPEVPEATANRSCRIGYRPNCEPRLRFRRHDPGLRRICQGDEPPAAAQSIQSACAASAVMD